MAKRLLIGVLAGAFLAGGAGASAAPRARIAFASGDGIDVMSADGTGRAAIVRGAFAPAWSPDGRAIAYARFLSHERAQIWLTAPDGTGQRPLTRTPKRHVGEIQPAWSPDGRAVVFVRRLDSDERLVNSLVVAADGSERTIWRKAEHSLTFAGSPAWSPDGARILFARTKLVRGGDFIPSIYEIPAGGGKPKLLVRQADAPAFSPDGRQIAFVSVRDRNGKRCGEDECNFAGEIYVMNADGSGQRRLTNEDGDDEDPSWSADGQRITFDSDRNYTAGEHHEVYSMRADGSCLTWLTNGTANVGDPTWEPGAGLSSDPGGCGAVPRSPLISTREPPGRMREGGSIYWFGRVSWESLLLSDVSIGSDFADIGYADCEAFDPSGCGEAIDLGETSACSDNALRFLDARNLFVIRGTLAQGINVDPGLTEEYELFAGATTVKLFNLTRARFEQIVSQLFPVGAAGPPATFPRPALPARYWRRLDAIEAAKRRLHTVAAVARALHLHKADVRDRLRLAALLRSLGPRQVAHCPARG